MSFNSNIILVKNIKMDKKYRNVLSYSEAQMLELCRANKSIELTKYSFIRDKKQSIKVEYPYDACLACNYIAFQNTDYSGKWFFAFIDRVNYLSNAVTEIEYTVDIWSTWFSYWTPQTCYVNREHVNDDTIGLHTIPENIDVGEVIQEAAYEDTSYNYYWVAISSSWDIFKQSQFSGINIVNKSVWGKKVFLEKYDAEGLKNLGLFLYKTASDKHIEDVGDIFLVPDICINQANLTQRTFTIGEESGYYYELPLVDMTVPTFNTSVPKLTKFSDYTPKNNKCLVYPYNYILGSNNNGTVNIYKYEDFSTDTCNFRNDCVLSIGGSGRLVPLNYKGMSTNDDESMSLGKFPTCGWSSDSFTNWLTQNAVSLATNNTLTVAQQAAELNAGTVAGNIANQIGQFYVASLMPNIEHGNMNVGDVLFATNRLTFSLRAMRAKTEYMKIIDNFFTRFGYKINQIKKPNITGRRYFNYVEIGQDDFIGYGNVPSNFMEEINNACRAGVTIWHDHENLGDYSLNNTIV